MLGLVAVRKNAIIGGRAWAATNGAIRGAQKEKTARDCAALGREAQLELVALSALQSVEFCLENGSVTFVEFFHSCAERWGNFPPGLIHHLGQLD